MIKFVLSLVALAGFAAEGQCCGVSCGGGQVAVAAPVVQTQVAVAAPVVQSSCGVASVAVAAPVFQTFAVAAVPTVAVVATPVVAVNVHHGAKVVQRRGLFGAQVTRVK